MRSMAGRVVAKQYRFLTGGNLKTNLEEKRVVTIEGVFEHTKAFSKGR